MPDAIVFDFDGVIVDSEPLHYRAFLDVLGPLGVSFDYPHYVARYIGFDDREGLRAMSADHDLSLRESDIERLRGLKGVAFENLARTGATPLPGVLDLIRAAAARMPIAIASGATRADIETILPALDNGELPACFSAIVTADDVERSKPDPQTYRLAAERLGVAPERALAIEDTQAGIESARAAGMRVLGVGATHTPDALAKADRIVQSLADVDIDRLFDWFG